MAGHARTRDAADVHADVEAVGPVRGAQRDARALDRVHHVRSLVRIEALEIADVTQWGDHEVARRVRVRVHHRERAWRALQRERLVVGELREAAEQAVVRMLGRVRGNTLDVRGPPAGPESVEHPPRYRRSATSAARCSMNRSRGTSLSGGASLPRLFTPTVPFSASSSPTTRM